MRYALFVLPQPFALEKQPTLSLLPHPSGQVHGRRRDRSQLGALHWLQAQCAADGVSQDTEVRLQRHNGKGP